MGDTIDEETYTNLSSVTNELLKEYDNKFNDNYNDIVQLNSSIQNKEELILKINEVILYRERNIIILQYLLFYSLIFLVSTFLYKSKIIPFSTYILLIIILFIVLAIACYKHLAKHFSYYNISTKLRSLRVAMRKYADKILKDKIPPYTCPNECSNADEEDQDTTDDSFNYKNNANLLKTDPTLDVWKYGDVPQIQNKLNYEDLIDEEDLPQSTFGTTYPVSTYYECKWLGNSTSKNMPTVMRGQGGKKYSSIPCHYKPNNTEINRWFCKKDPNDLDDDDKERYCEKVN